MTSPIAGDREALLQLADRIDQASGGPLYIDHLASSALRSAAALLEPVGEGALLEQARIALGLMLSYHGQGNSDYADVAQVKAQEAYDAIEDAIAASPKSKDQP